MRNGIRSDSSYMKRLVVPAMVAEKKALVRGIDDNGVVGNALGVEIIEYATDVVIT